MLELKFGLWTWAFHVVLIQNSHSSLKLMASIFFKCIELPTRIWAFSLFTILMVWDRTWGKLLRLQDLKIQTMLKVVFLFSFLNKNFQSSSASHYPYFPLYCLSLKKCWPCPVVWYNSLYKVREAWKWRAYYLYNQRISEIKLTFIENLQWAHHFHLFRLQNNCVNWSAIFDVVIGILSITMIQ